MRDALGFLQSFLAVSKVAKDQQRGQRIGEPPADLLEKPLLLARPDPRIRALVQPEQVGLVYLGVDGHGNLGLDVETLRQPSRQPMFRAWSKLYGSARSPHRSEQLGDVGVHR